MLPFLPKVTQMTHISEGKDLLHHLVIVVSTSFNIFSQLFLGSLLLKLDLITALSVALGVIYILLSAWTGQSRSNLRLPNPFLYFFKLLLNLDNFFSVSPFCAFSN